MTLEGGIISNLFCIVVVPGESGSVVVDQETFSVYGHVMGSDRLGHALIIPLCDTIQQIMFAFNAKSVSLPQEAKGHNIRHQSPSQYSSSQELLERRPITKALGMPTFQQLPNLPLRRELSTESPRNPLESVLSSSFLEHTRRKEPQVNTCMTCHASFNTNSDLERHARIAQHSAFLCTCHASFGRLSSLARHINNSTGAGYRCGLCEDRTLPRVDKIYDHLRDAHKVSQKVLDRYRNQAQGDAETSRPIKSATASAASPQFTRGSGRDSNWSNSTQIEGMTGGYNNAITTLSPNGVDHVNIKVRLLT